VHARIVGWLLHRDNLCESCRKNPAVVMLTYDDIETHEVCNDCIPDSSTDEIAEVFKRLG
jgi:protein-arginine kinase activator protein McsA